VKWRAPFWRPLGAEIACPPSSIALVPEWSRPSGGAGLNRLCGSWTKLPPPQLFASGGLGESTQRLKAGGGRRIQTSFVARLPWAAAMYSSTCPCCRWRSEQLDLSGYPWCIQQAAIWWPGDSSPHRTSCMSAMYTRRPLRLGPDAHAYLAGSASPAARLGPWVQLANCTSCAQWDVISSRRPNRLIAKLARFTARADSIRSGGARLRFSIPPVNVERFPRDLPREETINLSSLPVGALQRVHLVVQAFTAAGLHLDRCR